MGETMSKHPHWVAIASLAVAIVLSVVSGSVAYGSLNKQVDVNTDEIVAMQGDLKEVPNKETIRAMRDDITDIRNYLLGEKKN